MLTACLGAAAARGIRTLWIVAGVITLLSIIADREGPHRTLTRSTGRIPCWKGCTMTTGWRRGHRGQPKEPVHPSGNTLLDGLIGFTR
jgi:hypothetical protein